MPVVFRNADRRNWRCALGLHRLTIGGRLRMQGWIGFDEYSRWRCLCGRYEYVAQNGHLMERQDAR